MTLDFTALADFASDDTAPPLPTAGISLDTRYRPAAVLAFDQSLGNCGWVHVQTLSGVLSVVAHGVLKPREGLNLKSNLDMLTATEELSSRIYALVQDLNVTTSIVEQMEWLHETPPHMGKVPGNGASSLLAAAAVRFAARAYGKTVVSIGSQTAKKALTGSAKAEKPKVRAAVDALPVVGSRPTNEHTREALALAVTYLREA